MKSELLEIVRKHGLLVMDEPVQLASGEMSRYFIDGKRALAHGPYLKLACEALIESVHSAGITFGAVGGLTLGADQFAHGTAIVGGVDWFVVRKQAKGRGTNRRIEGAPLTAGDRVLLVDDVVSSGGSIQEAYHAIRETGAEVVAAVTLVDRGEVASAFFKAQSVPYLPLLTYRELEIPPVGHGREPTAAAG
ncbi:orotate phosphoribosyltransferase [Iamia sp.]|uniref:orotate phosphoribosyltransferase n=1 Tax=Iamia sp. TaxID=2722710 RepID=UPI002BBCA795|nr:orotate phosphoribosyltransferase [Iamia sp.]HXH59121.1 orotate phosphoribosyltransferase [Iamia sp.]